MRKTKLETAANLLMTLLEDCIYDLTQDHIDEDEKTLLNNDITILRLTIANMLYLDYKGCDTLDNNN